MPPGVTVRTSTGMEQAHNAGVPMLAGIDLAYAFGAHKAQGMTFGKSIAVMDSRTGKLLSACNTGDKTSALEVTYRLGTAAAKGQKAGKPPES